MGKEKVVTEDVLWSCVPESYVILSTSVTSTNSIKRKKINEEINLVCGNKNLSNIEKIKFSYTNSENYGLWVIMICHMGASVVRNMHTVLVRDVDDEGGLFMCGDRTCMGSPVPSIQFCWEPKTASKKLKKNPFPSLIVNVFIIINYRIVLLLHSSIFTSHSVLIN